MWRKAYAVAGSRASMHPAAHAVPFYPVADRVSALGITVLLFSCIFLQRFGIPASETQTISIPFVMGYLVFGYLLLRGRMFVSPGLLVGYCAAMALITLSFVASDIVPSLLSYFYLLSIYLLYVFKLRYREGCFEHAVDVFQNFMLVAAIFGIAQFVGQFFLDRELVFPIDTFLPPEILLTETFNIIIPLTYESEIMKSNGVFFLEPSFFSQFLAIAIVAELTTRQRMRRLLVYGTGLLVAYSGTGLGLVAVLLPWILYRRGNVQLLVWGFIGIGFLAIAGDALNLDAVTNRLGEFDETQSSGFARFISPILLIRDFLLDSAKGFFFGLGAGSIEDVMTASRVNDYLSHDPTWIKLLIEYGFLAFMTVMAFVLMALGHGNRHPVIFVAVTLTFLVLGGYLLNGTMHVLFVTLMAWHSDPTRGVVVRPAAPLRQRPIRLESEEAPR
jgi:hypothetical protein